MVLKEVRNGEHDTHSTKMAGDCKQTGEYAEVTSFFNGRKECKTDLQKTYRFAGYSCSLSYSNPSCVDVCTLIQKECL